MVADDRGRRCGVRFLGFAGAVEDVEELGDGVGTFDANWHATFRRGDAEVLLGYHCVLDLI